MIDYRIIAGRPVRACQVRPHVIYRDEPDWLLEFAAAGLLALLLAVLIFLPVLMS